MSSLLVVTLSKALILNQKLLPQDSEYVVAERNFITEDRALLSFHKGDIIRLQAMDGLEEGEKECTRMHTFKSIVLSHNQ